MPTASLVSAEVPDDIAGAENTTEDEDERYKDEGSEGGEDHREEREEQRERLGNRLFKKFRALMRTYEESMQQPTQNIAEATLISSLYTALHVAFARAATAHILDAGRFRELVSRLTYSWTNGVWSPMPPGLRNEVEESTGCATISLAAIAAATSPWTRQHSGDQDEFDAEMFTELVGTMKELRPFFLELKDSFKAGSPGARWTKAAYEYAKLTLERTNPLLRFEDLERRYEVWHLDEKSLLQRELKKLELHGTTELENGVLRIRAPLPDSMYRKDRLAKLLYLVNEGVDDRAAVVWSNSEGLGTIRQIALVLDPEQKAVLEVTRYARGNFLFWRHSARGGTSTGGVSLINARSLPSTLLNASNQTSPDAILMDLAQTLMPDLFR